MKLAFTGAVAALALSSVASADVITTYADQDQFGDSSTLGSGYTATVQQGGIRGGTSGSRFLNVEGRSNGDFASWGAVRFDLSELYAYLDTQAINAGQGAGDWQINSVSLVLEESPAGFSVGGGIEVYHATNDSTNINPASASGALGFGTVLGGNRMYDGSLGTASFLSNHTYTDSGSAGSQEIVDISGVLSMGELSGADDMLTLVLDSDNTGVAATYKGQDSPFGGVDAPALAIDFTVVPAPSGVAMLGLGGLVAARRRR